MGREVQAWVGGWGVTELAVGWRPHSLGGQMFTFASCKLTWGLLGSVLLQLLMKGSGVPCSLPNLAVSLGAQWFAHSLFPPRSFYLLS